MSCAAARKTSGCGFAARHGVRSHDLREPARQAELAQRVGHVLERRGSGQRGGKAPAFQHVEERDEARQRRQTSPRELAIDGFLLLREAALVVLREVALEQDRKDVAVALAVEAGAHVGGQAGQPVAGGEQSERLFVQGHVGHERAVEVEHEAARMRNFGGTRHGRRLSHATLSLRDLDSRSTRLDRRARTAAAMKDA
jgi:hypothetical protein